MILEQLLSPAVFEWYDLFQKKMNESHIDMTPEQVEKEFDNWLVKNEEFVNKSVEDNKREINESIDAAVNLFKLNEGLFDDDAFTDEDDEPEDDIEDKPISGEVSGELDVPEEISTTLTGAVRLSNTKSDPKHNVFVSINALYDRLKKQGKNLDKNSLFFRKLNVSDVRDMSALFAFADLPEADLSSWDTSGVKHMEGMFYKSSFNNDSICDWNVSSCSDFKNMFSFSKFNQSLKKWTPAFVSGIERDADGRIMRDSSGQPIKKSVRADLPLVGAAADEETELLVQHWNEIFDEIEKEDTTKTNEEKYVHVIDFDTFINEGKFKDYMNKGFDKIKGFFKTIGLKFGNIVSFFKEDGEIYPATSVYTSLNTIANGDVSGVTAFCAVRNDYINDNVKERANIVESPEYYGIIDKNSIEYRNYQTFKGMINEHYEKYGNTGCFQMINESDEQNFKRVGFKGVDGGLRDIPDINSKQLGEILKDAIQNVPAYKGDNAGGSILIWGAPGIGKSSIPKTIINKWNEDVDEFHKKAIMVVECGDLTVDGFTLPIPVDKTVEEYLEDRPKVNDIIKKSGVALDSIEKIKRNMHKISTEAPKSWLPCFRVTTNQDEVNILNDIANGHVEKKNKHGLLTVTETTEGGILLMDEFFRADESIFKILMQLLLTRTYNDEFMLGNKWAIVCCSNRPNDDAEVERGYGSTGAVVGTRFLGGQYNFIPNFDDWKKWAISEGGFDDVTLEFLMFDKDDNGEYTNWHTIRPEEYEKGKSGWPTPRTWSAFINELNLYKDNHGYVSIEDIPLDVIELKGSAIIGAEMAKKYVNFLASHSKSSVKVKNIFEDSKYVIPSDVKCSEVCRKIENYVKVSYSPDAIPDVELLVNMFNNLNRTYNSSKDNIVKIMHINIIKFFDAYKNKTTRIELKDYLQAVDKRFNLTSADLK